MGWRKISPRRNTVSSRPGRRLGTPAPSTLTVSPVTAATWTSTFGKAATSSSATFW